MDITETLAYIHSVKWQGSKPGLERTRELLEALGDPEKSLRFVHIAGTNGKGSTAAIIASVLQKAGYTTGLYTSPYILCFNERMQVDGVCISDEELIRMTEEIRPHADSMKDSPTEFELITALAMKHFLHKKCEIIVLEAGMGGELDSTNVIDTPDAAIITAIGFDHVKELGPSLADIAKAKAGIIKEGGDVVVYGGEAEVENVFERACGERGAKLWKTDFSRIGSQDFTLERVKFELKPYGELSLPLAGTYQPKNAAVAVTALEVLRKKGFRISDPDIKKGLEAVIWPGRFELLGRDPVFILDGTHNPQGVEATADSLRRHFGGEKITFVIGVMADKDVDSMIGLIAPMAESFFAVRPDYYRAMDINTLTEKLSRFGAPVLSFDSLRDGVAAAIGRAGESGVVCALGSLYFSGEVRAAYSAASESR